MRILIQKRYDGQSAVMVIPGRRRGLGAWTIYGVDRGNRREKIGAAVEKALRGMPGGQAAAG